MIKTYYRKSNLEAKAEERIIEYQQKFGEIKEPPVPIEELTEHTFDLKISYEKIEALNGEKILGSLRPRNRQIVINEEHVTLFDDKPGLLRSTLGHELGHWDLFIDQATLDHPCLPGFEPAEHFAKRSSSNGEVEIIQQLAINPELYSEYRKMTTSKDSPIVKSAVDYYASVLSMPKFLIIPVIKNLIHDNWTDWSQKPYNYQLADLYNVKDLFEVTISALFVRLEQLGLLYIDSDKKIIYRNKAELNGQMRLI